MEFIMAGILNTKPELGINFNDLPPGSYIIRDGKLLPNPDDEAMKKRSPDNTDDEEIKKEKLKDKEV